LFAIFDLLVLADQLCLKKVASRVSGCQLSEIRYAMTSDFKKLDVIESLDTGKLKWTFNRLQKDKPHTY